MENSSDGSDAIELCEISILVIEPNDIRFNVDDVFNFGLQFLIAAKSHLILFAKEIKNYIHQKRRK